MIHDVIRFETDDILLAVLNEAIRIGKVPVGARRYVAVGFENGKYFATIGPPRDEPGKDSPCSAAS